VVARSATLKAALRRSDQFALEAEFPPYEVHRVLGNGGRYVVPLDHEPVLLTSGDWKHDFYSWFKRPDADGVVLAWAPEREANGRDRFRLSAGALPEHAPRVELATAGVTVEEELGDHRIRIRTSRPGHPLLVRVSYHPRWRSLGGERIYLASPGFMLLFPESREVTLEFGDPPLVRFGHLLTAFGCALAATASLRGVRRRPNRDRAGASPAPPWTPGWQGLAGPAIAVTVALGAWAATGLGERPYAPALYERGLELYRMERFEAAQPVFERAQALEPLSSAALHSSFYRGLCAYRRERWQETIELFSDMLSRFPESPYRAEGEYHIALCRRNLGDRDGARSALRGVVEAFPGTEWAGYAAESLGELTLARTDGGPDRSGLANRRPT
jgi:hypothetical protein